MTYSLPDFCTFKRLQNGMLVSLSLLLSACGGGGSGSTGSYNIGGSISNLTTAGLVLSNGSDTLAIPAKASSFTFPTQQGSKTAYKVSIVSQPPGFTDICSLSGDSGTVAADVTSVVVACHPAVAAVTTLAGSGSTGSVDGSSTSASFDFPVGLAVDSSGTVYVSEQNSNLIRKIAATGTVSLFAGSGALGSSDGAGNAASFNRPNGLALDAGSNLYVADGYGLVRKISSAGAVSTLPGNSAASKTCPCAGGVAFDGSGNLYASVLSDSLIRKINTAGVNNILVAPGLPVGASSISIDSNGNIYAVEPSTHVVRKINPAGVPATLAGSGIAGSANGNGVAASFNFPNGVVVDKSGTVYVADSRNQLIRKISAAGVVTTLAGSGSQGKVNGNGTAASFNYPTGLAIDSAGNLYVADSGNNLVRKITPQ
ncbi:hypothetical protein [Undibacterium sp. TJN19]|uniref:hypothetical protein n=1 Tax=Undibacterium sp. TJN19 TaxID=3413055 RepID=UPI003BF3BD02